MSTSSPPAGAEEPDGAVAGQESVADGKEEVVGGQEADGKTGIKRNSPRSARPKPGSLVEVEEEQIAEKKVKTSSSDGMTETPRARPRRGNSLQTRKKKESGNEVQASSSDGMTGTTRARPRQGCSLQTRKKKGNGDEVQAPSSEAVTETPRARPRKKKNDGDEVQANGVKNQPRSRSGWGRPPKKLEGNDDGDQASITDGVTTNESPPKPRRSKSTPIKKKEENGNAVQTGNDPSTSTPIPSEAYDFVKSFLEKEASTPAEEIILKLKSLVVNQPSTSSAAEPVVQDAPPPTDKPSTSPKSLRQKRLSKEIKATDVGLFKSDRSNINRYYFVPFGKLEKKTEEACLEIASIIHDCIQKYKEEIQLKKCEGLLRKDLKLLRVNERAMGTLKQMVKCFENKIPYKGMIPKPVTPHYIPSFNSEISFDHALQIEIWTSREAHQLHEDSIKANIVTEEGLATFVALVKHVLGLWKKSVEEEYKKSDQAKQINMIKKFVREFLSDMLGYKLKFVRNLTQIHILGNPSAIKLKELLKSPDSSEMIEEAAKLASVLCLMQLPKATNDQWTVYLDDLLLTQFLVADEGLRGRIVERVIQFRSGYTHPIPLLSEQLDLSDDPQEPMEVDAPAMNSTMIGPQASDLTDSTDDSGPSSAPSTSDALPKLLNSLPHPNDQNLEMEVDADQPRQSGKKIGSDKAPGSSSAPSTLESQGALKKTAVAPEAPPQDNCDEPEPMQIKTKKRGRPKKYEHLPGDNGPEVEDQKDQKIKTDGPPQVKKMKVGGSQQNQKKDANEETQKKTKKMTRKRKTLNTRDRKKHRTTRRTKPKQKSKDEADEIPPPGDDVDRVEESKEDKEKDHQPYDPQAPGPSNRVNSMDTEKEVDDWPSNPTGHQTEFDVSYHMVREPDVDTTSEIAQPVVEEPRNGIESLHGDTESVSAKILENGLTSEVTRDDDTKSIASNGPMEPTCEPDKEIEKKEDSKIAESTEKDAQNSSDGQQKANEIEQIDIDVPADSTCEPAKQPDAAITSESDQPVVEVPQNGVESESRHVTTETVRMLENSQLSEGNAESLVKNMRLDEPMDSIYEEIKKTDASITPKNVQSTEDQTSDESINVSGTTGLTSEPASETKEPSRSTVLDNAKPTTMNSTRSTAEEQIKANLAGSKDSPPVDQVNNPDAVSCPEGIQSSEGEIQNPQSLADHMEHVVSDESMNIAREPVVEVDKSEDDRIPKAGQLTDQNHVEQQKRDDQVEPNDYTHEPATEDEKPDAPIVLEDADPTTLETIQKLVEDQLRDVEIEPASIDGIVNSNPTEQEMKPDEVNILENGDPSETRGQNSIEPNNIVGPMDSIRSPTEENEKPETTLVLESAQLTELPSPFDEKTRDEEIESIDSDVLMKSTCESDEAAKTTENIESAEKDAESPSDSQQKANEIEQIDPIIDEESMYFTPNTTVELKEPDAVTETDDTQSDVKRAESPINDQSSNDPIEAMHCDKSADVQNLHESTGSYGDQPQKLVDEDQQSEQPIDQSGEVDGALEPEESEDRMEYENSVYQHLTDNTSQAVESQELKDSEAPGSSSNSPEVLIPNDVQMSEEAQRSNDVHKQLVAQYSEMLSGLDVAQNSSGTQESQDSLVVPNEAQSAEELPKPDEALMSDDSQQSGIAHSLNTPAEDEETPMAPSEIHVSEEFELADEADEHPEQPRTSQSVSMSDEIQNSSETQEPPAKEHVQTELDANEFDKIIDEKPESGEFVPMNGPININPNDLGDSFLLWCDPKLKIAPSPEEQPSTSADRQVPEEPKRIEEVDQHPEQPQSSEVVQTFEETQTSSEIQPSVEQHEPTATDVEEFNKHTESMMDCDDAGVIGNFIGDAEEPEMEYSPNSEEAPQKPTTNHVTQDHQLAEVVDQHPEQPQSSEVVQSSDETQKSSEIQKPFVEQNVPTAIDAEELDKIMEPMEYIESDVAEEDVEVSEKSMIAKEPEITEQINHQVDELGQTEQHFDNFIVAEKTTEADSAPEEASTEDKNIQNDSEMSDESGKPVESVPHEIPAYNESIQMSKEQSQKTCNSETTADSDETEKDGAEQRAELQNLDNTKPSEAFKNRSDSQEHEKAQDVGEPGQTAHHFDYINQSNDAEEIVDGSPIIEENEEPLKQDAEMTDKANDLERDKLVFDLAQQHDGIEMLEKLQKSDETDAISRDKLAHHTDLSADEPKVADSTHGETSTDDGDVPSLLQTSHLSDNVIGFEKPQEDKSTPDETSTRNDGIPSLVEHIQKKNDAVMMDEPGIERERKMAEDDQLSEETQKFDGAQKCEEPIHEIQSVDQHAQAAQTSDSSALADELEKTEPTASETLAANGEIPLSEEQAQKQHDSEMPEESEGTEREGQMDDEPAEILKTGNDEQPEVNHKTMGEAQSLHQIAQCSNNSQEPDTTTTPGGHQQLQHVDEDIQRSVQQMSRPEMFEDIEKPESEDPISETPTVMRTHHVVHCSDTDEPEKAEPTASETSATKGEIPLAKEQAQEQPENEGGEPIAEEPVDIQESDNDEQPEVIQKTTEEVEEPDQIAQNCNKDSLEADITTTTATTEPQQTGEDIQGRVQTPNDPEMLEDPEHPESKEPISETPTVMRADHFGHPSDADKLDRAESTASETPKDNGEIPLSEEQAKKQLDVEMSDESDEKEGMDDEPSGILKSRNDENPEIVENSTEGAEKSHQLVQDSNNSQEANTKAHVNLQHVEEDTKMSAEGVEEQRDAVIKDDLKMSKSEEPTVIQQPDDIQLSEDPLKSEEISTTSQPIVSMPEENIGPIVNEAPREVADESGEILEQSIIQEPMNIQQPGEPQDANRPAGNQPIRVVDNKEKPKVQSSNDCTKMYFVVEPKKLEDQADSGSEAGPEDEPEDELENGSDDEPEDEFEDGSEDGLEDGSDVGSDDESEAGSDAAELMEPESKGYITSGEVNKPPAETQASQSTSHHQQPTKSGDQSVEAVMHDEVPSSEKTQATMDVQEPKEAVQKEIELQKIVEDLKGPPTSEEVKLARVIGQTEESSQQPSSTDDHSPVLSVGTQGTEIRGHSVQQPIQNSHGAEEPHQQQENHQTSTPAKKVIDVQGSEANGTKVSVKSEEPDHDSLDGPSQPQHRSDPQPPLVDKDIPVITLSDDDDDEPRHVQGSEPQLNGIVADASNSASNHDAGSVATVKVNTAVDDREEPIRNSASPGNSKNELQDGLEPKRNNRDEKPSPIIESKECDQNRLNQLIASRVISSADRPSEEDDNTASPSSRQTYGDDQEGATDDDDEDNDSQDQPKPVYIQAQHQSTEINRVIEDRNFTPPSNTLSETLQHCNAVLTNSKEPPATLAQPSSIVPEPSSAGSQEAIPRKDAASILTPTTQCSTSTSLRSIESNPRAPGVAHDTTLHRSTQLAQPAKGSEVKEQEGSLNRDYRVKLQNPRRSIEQDFPSCSALSAQPPTSEPFTSDGQVKQTRMKRKPSEEDDVECEAKKPRETDEPTSGCSRTTEISTKYSERPRKRPAGVLEGPISKRRPAVMAEQDLPRPSDREVQHADLQDQAIEDQVPPADLQDPIIAEQVPPADLQDPILEEHVPPADLQDPILAEQVPPADLQDPIIAEQVPPADPQDLQAPPPNQSGPQEDSPEAPQIGIIFMNYIRQRQEDTATTMQAALNGLTREQAINWIQATPTLLLKWTYELPVDFPNRQMYINIFQSNGVRDPDAALPAEPVADPAPAPVVAPDLALTPPPDLSPALAPPVLARTSIPPEGPAPALAQPGSQLLQDPAGAPRLAPETPASQAHSVPVIPVAPVLEDPTAADPIPPIARQGPNPPDVPHLVQDPAPAPVVAPDLALTPPPALLPALAPPVLALQSPLPGGPDPALAQRVPQILQDPIAAPRLASEAPAFQAHAVSVVPVAPVLEDPTVHVADPIPPIARQGANPLEVPHRAQDPAPAPAPVSLGQFLETYSQLFTSVDLHFMLTNIANGQSEESQVHLGQNAIRHAQTMINQIPLPFQIGLEQLENCRKQHVHIYMQAQAQVAQMPRAPMPQNQMGLMPGVPPMNLAIHQLPPIRHAQAGSVPIPPAPTAPAQRPPGQILHLQMHPQQLQIMGAQVEQMMAQMTDAQRDQTIQQLLAHFKQVVPAQMHHVQGGQARIVNAPMNPAHMAPVPMRQAPMAQPGQAHPMHHAHAGQPQVRQDPMDQLRPHRGSLPSYDAQHSAAPLAPVPAQRGGNRRRAPERQEAGHPGLLQIPEHLRQAHQDRQQMGQGQGQLGSNQGQPGPQQAQPQVIRPPANWVEAQLAAAARRQAQNQLQPEDQGNRPPPVPHQALRHLEAQVADRQPHQRRNSVPHPVQPHHEYLAEVEAEQDARKAAQNPSRADAQVQKMLNRRGAQAQERARAQEAQNQLHLEHQAQIHLHRRPAEPQPNNQAQFLGLVPPSQPWGQVQGELEVMLNPAADPAGLQGAIDNRAQQLRQRNQVRQAPGSSVRGNRQSTPSSRGNPKRPNGGNRQ